MTPKGKSRTELEGDVSLLRRQIETLEPLSARAEQAEDELARFFTQSLDLLCIASLDGYFKRLNPAWTTVLGWTLEELEGSPFIDFVHPDDRTATLAEVATLAEGADTILFENRYRHQDGSYRWLRWNARAVPGRRRIYATARDVTEQKRLEREILEIADREKQRFGHELHDGLCQTLAGIAALSSMLSQKLATGSDPAAAATATDIADLLRQAIAEARSLAHGLDPAGIEDAGLETALEALASNVEHLFNVSCTFQSKGRFSRFSPEAEAHLLRIAQEAVSNAVKHGQADRIEISLSEEGNNGLLSVRDDGVGLPEKTADLEGIGMHTMAYRSRLIGASLTVRRRARRGTAVICALALPARQQSHGTEKSSRPGSP